jgi:hypothetical protein
MILRVHSAQHKHNALQVHHACQFNPFWNLFCVRIKFLFKNLLHNLDRLCGLVVRVSGYRSRGPWFDSRRYQIFWEVVGLERGPLSPVSTTEELLGRKSNSSCLENREYVHRNPLRWPRDTLHPQKLALTSPTSGGRSVGIVRSRTKATEFVVFYCLTQSYFSSSTTHSFSFMPVPVRSPSVSRPTGFWWESQKEITTRKT